MTCLSQLDVVILAGGLGTRLHSRFSGLPKVMVPVNGRPFLSYLLDQVQASGARRVVLALGHLSEVVQDYVRAREGHELEIVVHVESEPRGTGGAFREVLPLIGSDTVMGMNGDCYTKADLCRFLAFHRSRPAAASILLTHLPSVGRYGVVKVDAAGRVLSFAEKPRDSHTGGYINTGIYLFDKTVIHEIPPNQAVSVEYDVFPRLSSQGSLYAMRSESPFIDIGTPDSYDRAGEFLSEAGCDN